MLDKTINRRDAIKWSLTAGIAAMTRVPKVRAIDYTQPVPDAKGLTAYLKDEQVQLRWHNMPLTAYRAKPSQKYPYFYPLNGLASGTSLTSESALPYPHHRGLWLGCEPLNGGDYWADNGLESGKVKSVGLELWVKQQNSPPCSPTAAGGFARTLYQHVLMNESSLSRMLNLISYVDFVLWINK